jgi:hypothetical protein
MNAFVSAVCERSARGLPMADIHRSPRTSSVQVSDLSRWCAIRDSNPEPAD